MSAPLRVALIASNRFPLCQPFAGGLEAHVWHLARSLIDRGHEVSLFAAEPTRDGRQRSEQLARQLEPDQAPEQIAADRRQMIDVSVTAAGAKLPSSTRRQGQGL